MKQRGMSAVDPNPEHSQWTPISNPWVPIRDGDLRAFALYRRHYSAPRKKHGIIRVRRFAPPGERMALMTIEQNALWLWTRERYRRDGQEGICCAVFRNEGDRLSSDLVLAAEEWAQSKWGRKRMFTYVNPRRVASPNPGYCFKCAGWRQCGKSPNGLVILQKLIKAA